MVVIVLYTSLSERWVRGDTQRTLQSGHAPRSATEIKNGRNEPKMAAEGAWTIFKKEES